MSPENIPAKPAPKDDTQSSGGRKTAPLRPPEQALKCPRCDSPNTKFCYYNNYSLTQPRHFCKTCRRYWTKGGALRNVPIGGGCRKNKKLKSSTSRLSGDSKDSATSSDLGGLKFFHGLSPAVDFQLGGLSLPRLHSATTTTSVYNQFSSFGDISAVDQMGSSSTPLMGFNNYPLSSVPIQDTGSMNVHSSLASSIESLSSINQDLHWKLQQQRLAMMFGGDNEKDTSPSSQNPSPKPQPIVFQNLEISKPEICGSMGNNSRRDGSASGNATTTEWFFDNPYAQVANGTNHPPGNGGSGGDNSSNWNGIQAWSDLQQYSALP